MTTYASDANAADFLGDNGGNSFQTGIEGSARLTPEQMAEARARKVGLWSDPHARPPDEWRAGLIDGNVKKSRTGICHTPDSQSYRSVRYFTSFATLEGCLASGGRLPRG